MARVKQEGVALLVAMMVLLSGSALFLVNEHRAGIRDNRLQSLLSAKQALLAYAVNYADNYGHNTRGGTGRLPCPSMERHGSPASSCQVNSIGFLPSVWSRNSRQMEIDYLEQFLDQDIWYSVSADHRFNPAFNSLNSNRGSNLLTVDSIEDVVAVLISPGQALDYQNRSGDNSTHPAAVIRDYLEGENADADSEFTITNQNDLVVMIRRDELVYLMERRVLGHVKQWLIDYKSTHGYYPFAANVGGDGHCAHGSSRGLLAIERGNCGDNNFIDVAFDNIPRGRALRQTWFTRYGWPSLIYYMVDDTCTPVRGTTDCDNVDDPERSLRVDGEQVEVIIVSVGEPIETLPAQGLQDRTSAQLVNYLDTQELLNGVDEFTAPRLTEASNDQLVFIN